MPFRRTAALEKRALQEGTETTKNEEGLVWSVPVSPHARARGPTRPFAFHLMPRVERPPTLVTAAAIVAAAFVAIMACIALLVWHARP